MRREPTSDVQVAALLEDLGSRVVFPPTPDLVPRVTERLTQVEKTATDDAIARPWFTRPLFATAVLVIVAIAASLVLSASARRAVADLLGVVGITIEFDGGVDGSKGKDLPPPDLDGLDLGAAVTRSEAETAVGFEIRGPSALAQRSELYLDPDIGDSGMVSTVFRDRDGNVRFLVTEFRADVADEFIKKAATGEVHVDNPQIGDTYGYWLFGRPHSFSYLDADGTIRQETVRSAGNVLLWDSEGITYRIEGPRSLSAAIGMTERMGF